MKKRITVKIDNIKQFSIDIDMEESSYYLFMSALNDSLYGYMYRACDDWYEENDDSAQRFEIFTETIL